MEVYGLLSWHLQGCDGWEYWRKEELIAVVLNYPFDAQQLLQMVVFFTVLGRFI